MAEDRISSVIDVQAVKDEISQVKSEIDALVKLLQSVKGKSIEISGVKNLGDLNKLKTELDDLIDKTQTSSTKIIAAKKAEANANEMVSKTVEENIKLQTQYKDKITELTTQLKELKKQQDLISKTTGNEEAKKEIADRIQAHSLELAQIKASKQELDKYINAQLKGLPFTSAAEKAAAAAKKLADEEANAAKKAAELNEPYKKLVVQFNAAAREAKNLAAQYGVQSKQAQEAVKTALGLNNQLKAIDASIGNHQRNVGNYASAWDGVGGKLKQAGTAILGFLGITAGFHFIEDSIDQFLELDKALRLLQNTTRNLGVPELFDRITAKTEDLQQQFKFLANEDIASSFNKLLVYGKLSENQINDLLPVIVDFSAATGQSLPEATSILIRALEGNGRALKEFGINMKDAKTPAEGFKLIMEELKPRVEGVGEAFGESAAGKIASAREEFKQIKEEVGEKLIPALTALLGWISHIITGLGFLKDKVIDLGKEIIDFATGPAGLADKIARDVLKEIETESQAATLLIKDLVKQGITEPTDQIVQLNKQLFETTKLLNLAKKNQSGTFTQEDIDRYKKGISVIKKALKEAFKAASGDQDKNKPLLTGVDPEDAKKAEEAAKHLAEVQKKSLADQQAAILAFNKFRLEQEQEYLKFQRDNLAFAPGDRSQAAREISDKQKQILTDQANFELGKIQASEKELKDKGDFTITEEKAVALQRKLITEKLASDISEVETGLAIELSKINYTRVQDQKQVNDEINALFDEQAKKEAAEAEKNIKNLDRINKERQDSIEIDADTQLTNLNEQYKKGEVSKEQYERRKLKIEKDALKESLLAQIDYYSKLLEFADISAEQRAEAEKKLAKARKELSDQGKDEASDSIKNLASAFKQIADIGEQVQNVFSVIGKAISASADREKNAIQEQIDLLEQKRLKDIEVANQTITNAADRANAITAIEATAAAKKAVLEQRQRQADERKARFDKTAGLLAIIVNTARGVTAALTSVPPNVPLAILTGAIGAAEFGIAAAAPIPKYKAGTKYHKGGLMEVGEGGKSEGVQLPDGSVIKTPAKSTIMNAPRGTKVHPDWDQMILNATVTKQPEFKIKTYSDGTKDAVKAIGKDIVKAIKGQPQPIFKGEAPYKKFFKRGSTWIEYIERNL